MTRAELQEIKDSLKYAGVDPDQALRLIDALEAAWADIETWIQWSYIVGLHLDWFTPALGVDNRFRIEKAVNALKAAVEERDDAVRRLNDVVKRHTTQDIREFGGCE